jgi:hypothetical protein
VSLTNIPAFEGLLPKIQEQISLSNNGQAKELVLLTENKGTNKKGGKKMPNFIQLTNALKLNPEASEDAITSEVMKIFDSLKAKDEKIVILEKTVTEKDEELSKRDEAIKALNKEFSELRTTQLEKEAKEYIDKAVSDGKIHPAIKEVKMSQYLKDPEGVKKELELIPVQQNNTQLTKTTTESGIKMKLSKSDELAMKGAGLNPEDPKDVETYQNAQETYTPKEIDEDDEDENNEGGE